MFDELETPIEEEKYFIARIDVHCTYVPLSIESLGIP